MLPGWILFATALIYLLLLFGVASYGDRRSALRMPGTAPRPIIYSLSLAVYCTSWTYLRGRRPGNASTGSSFWASISARS